ncbi:MAG: glycosyltransferase family 1 protein [Polaromonas sp.]|nr:MAG: glycosyltransferase family 1 protein [Polaromonas sp.]
MTARRLRIAVLNRTFSPTAGGAERYSIALVEQLAAKHDIHVFAQSIEHGWPGVTYHLVKTPMRRPRWVNQLWFATATWWATKKRFDPDLGTGFDVVHSHENTWHGDVQTVHVLPVKHNLFHGRTGWRLALRWLKVLTSPRLLVYLSLEHLRYAVRPGRAAVVTSDSLLAIFNANYPIAADMTSVVTPGIALPRLPISQADKYAARQQLGLPQAQPCILFVGNDFRKKGLSAVIDSLHALSEQVVLAVVGHSAQLPGFHQQVQAAGLGARVFFLGALDDVGPAYRAADCLAHPTLEDTFAMVVLEAMAHCLPVVVSSAKYCGIAGLLDEGVNALLLAEPRDVVALSDGLCRVLNDEGLKTKLAQAARVFAENFEWSARAAVQEEIYYASWAIRDKSETAT